MMSTVARELGLKRYLIPVPVLTPRLSAYWLGLTTAVPAAIARALIGGLKHDFSADDAALRRLVPQQLLGMREAIAAAFSAEREKRVAARWTEGALMYRNYRQDHAYYAKRSSGSAVTSATAEIARLMEGAADLQVPLVVDVGVGDNWEEAH